jgi:hypothetical protein
MDAELTKWFATLGVGGILAGFMFALYRKDIKQFTELWKMATDQLIIVIKENTASNTKLVGMLETMERNALRKTDIEEFVGRRATNSKPKGAE